AHGLRDVAGDLVLDGKHVAHLACVGLRPDVRRIIGPDQLRGDAQLVAVPAHAAFSRWETSSFRPISRMSSFLPLNEKLEVRPMTCSAGTCASWLMISSASPSARYDWSCAWERSVKGSTAMRCGVS